MDDKIEAYGTCTKCGLEKAPVTLFGNNELLCKFCLSSAKEQTDADRKRIEKPVDDFNALIRKCKS